MKLADRILTLILLSATIGVYGQQMNYAAWKEESKTNIRLLPEYGNVAKTQGQKEADEAFIKASLEQDGTREQASENMVKFGFSYLNKGDIRTAMYRFNQAWLLNPKNENAYWGFGAVYFTFNDLEKAMEQYDKGLKINPRSSYILTDKATVYTARQSMTGSKVDLDSAMTIFKRSYKIDPKNQNTLFKLSVCYFREGNCKDARRYYEECKALGGNPISQEYADALKKNCK